MNRIVFNVWKDLVMTVMPNDLECITFLFHNQYWLNLWKDLWVKKRYSYIADEVIDTFESKISRVRDH